MLTLVLVVVNFYDKLFITHRIIHTNKPSLTKWTNERDNLVVNLQQTSRFSKPDIFLLTKGKKKIYFLLPYYVTKKNCFFVHFLSKYSSSGMDSSIYFSSCFSSFLPFIVLAKVLANPNLLITTSWVSLSNSSCNIWWKGLPSGSLDN